MQRSIQKIRHEEWTTGAKIVKLFMTQTLCKNVSDHLLGWTIFEIHSIVHSFPMFNMARP
jgi:hypothetical protein